jgi:cytochrome b subunit of formate dehydrogenase
MFYFIFLAHKNMTIAKMKKIALHWQILIALILAIVFGLIFSTTYQLSDESYKMLNRQFVPYKIQEKLHQFDGITFKSWTEFSAELEQITDFERIEPYLPVIAKAAYHNPPVV